MKRVSMLKKTIAKMIIAVFLLGVLTGIGYFLYLMGGWQGILIVVGGASVLGALMWALDVLEVKGDEGPH